MLKNAVSPLIATVILVALAMVLGAIVMNFSQDTTQELTDKTTDKVERGLKCSLDLSLKVLEINNERFICYNRSGSDNLEVIVENSGEASAKGIRIFLLDNTDNPKTVDVIQSLGAHNRTKFNISINETDDNSQFVFPPSKVLISPIIEYTGSSVDICTDNRIDLDEVEVCE